MSSVTEASMRLAKASSDVCKRIGTWGTWAESEEAEVVNELVRAAQHYCAVHIRTLHAADKDCWGSDCCMLPAADEIDPEVT